MGRTKQATSTDTVLVLNTLNIAALQLEIAPECAADPDAAAVYAINRAVVQRLAVDGYQATAQAIPAGGLLLVYRVTGPWTKTAIEPGWQALLEQVAPLIKLLYDATDKKQGLKIVLEIAGALLEVGANDVAEHERISKLAKRWQTRTPWLKLTEQSQLCVCIKVRVPKRIAVRSN